MQEVTRKWIERAKYDLDTAEDMFTSGRYLYVAFMCQEAIEKILKGIIVENGGEVLRTHNLVRLAESAGMYNEMADENKDFLADLTPFAIESRYGDYRNRLSEIIGRKMARNYLDKTKEMYKWIKKRIKK